MDTVTKKNLVDAIAERTGEKRGTVKNVVQEFLDIVVDELGEGNRIEFRDFGVFEVKSRAARVAQNPRTLERIPVPPKRTVKFKPGRRMREALEKSAPEGAPQAEGESQGKPQARRDAGTPGRAEQSVEPKPQAADTHSVSSNHAATARA